MVLNGVGGAEVVFADTSAATVPWANATAGQVLLQAGNNTLSFFDDWNVEPANICHFTLLIVI
jgi:mannan endo-1,4-beta-mannosidase